MYKHKCVFACVFVRLTKTVDVSIPDAGSTMEPEQRDMSHGLSSPSPAAGLNASGGSRVHNFYVYLITFAAPFRLLYTDIMSYISAVEMSALSPI